jgi:predicted lipoprotein with Yx(FWY)xxD motif
MLRASTALAVCASLALAPAACGGDDGGSGDGSAAADTTATETTAGATANAAEDDQATSSRRRRGVRIKLMNSPRGKILVGPTGQVIYLFTKEAGDRSRCYGACARAWPPVLTKGKPRAGQGVDSSLLGTTKRRGGGRIATYNGHPLYYYAHEERRQVLCQAIEEFGGTWYVVAPGGDAITERFSVS